MRKYQRHYKHGIVRREDRGFANVWAALPHDTISGPFFPVQRFAAWDDALHYATTGEARNPITDPWLAPQIKGAQTDA
jgi:hypothetical protein